MRVFVHVLGESDIGVDSQAPFFPGLPGRPVDPAPGLADRVDRLRAAVETSDVPVVRSMLTKPAVSAVKEWANVPLQVLLADLEPADRLLLVATDVPVRAGYPDRNTCGLASQIRRAVSLVADVYGPALDPTALLDPVVVREGLSMGVFRRALERWLDGHREFERIVIGVGSGGTSFSLGCVLAAFSDGRPVDVQDIQVGPGGERVDVEVADHDPAPWLARRRMFGALGAHVGEDDRRTRNLLSLLDARQRLDLPRFNRLATDLGLPVAGTLSPRHPVALENAFFDRLYRREVQASMIGRAWLVSEYNERRGDRDPSIGKKEMLGPFLYRLSRAPKTPAVKAALANKWVNELGADKNKPGKNRHGLRVPTYGHLLSAAGPAQTADARDPRRQPDGLFARPLPGLEASVPDLFRWSSAASGQVLVVYCVGLREEGRDGGRPFAEAVLHPDTAKDLTDRIDSRPLVRQS